MYQQYSILMALMGLEIGGAETHVVELAKQLHKEGFRIVVASNGGVYVKELEEAGIRHYKVPMNKRNLINLRKSYYLLQEIIKKEKIDIVHSHARIPSFLCGLLHKKMKFPFVTSAHWVFYTGMGLKYLTNWGQKTVAVSDDIKAYLMDNYGVKAHDIFVTINGIDTDKFSPQVDCRVQKQEFSIAEEDNVVVYVSRMDEDRALVARQLIEIAPQLAKDIKRLRLVIVGGGNVFEKLSQMAVEANKKIGYDCIVMTGGRTDINRLVAMGKVFVGVSRAALEAMAGQKPVIIAGNEGYIGLFGEEKLALAQENNFCCRGCAMSDKEQLRRDLVYAMNTLSDEERLKLGQYGRQVIFDHYSVKKMAADCVKAYDAAWKKNNLPEYKVLISGYYGFQNCGDDAILLAMGNNIRAMEENISIRALANKPKESRKRYDMDVVNRYNVFQIMRAIGQCDVLISGGGSLLQDKTSARSILYYLTIIRYAKWKGKKVMMYANGIGPVKKSKNRQLVGDVVNRVDVITLRESSSLEELKAMGLTNPHTFVTADPVFTLPSIGKEKAMDILKKNGIPTDKPLLCVSVRSWKGTDFFFHQFAQICDRVVTQLGHHVVFIPMQMPNDIITSRLVQNKMKEPSFLLEEPLTPGETMGVIGCMNFVMSMRLHTLIFAAKERVPLMGFSYDPKIDYYLRDFAMPSGGTVESCNVEEAVEKMADLLAKRQESKDRLEAKAKELEQLAHQNEQYLRELFLESRLAK